MNFNKFTRIKIIIFMMSDSCDIKEKKVNCYIPESSKIALDKHNQNTEINHKISEQSELLNSSNVKKHLTSDSKSNDDSESKRQATSKNHLSPKSRLDLTSTSSSSQIKSKYIYGNYNKYYGYRLDDQHDIRLDVFKEYKDIFKDKEILDIGCNTGFITISIAKRFDIKSIIGFDIDENLITKARKSIQKSYKSASGSNKNSFPFNINFVHGNYILKDDILLEVEPENKFDIILCLSVTKWIHLNFGDAGLKQAFRRMYKQLKDGGKLILEPQPWSGYKRRKKLTPEIFENYKNIKFFPQDFNNYLCGPDVGFNSVDELKTPEHSIKGFRRPIYMFHKL